MKLPWVSRLTATLAQTLCLRDLHGYDRNDRRGYVKSSSLSSLQNIRRFVPALSLGGEFTRADTRKRRTGQRGASVSEWQSKELSPQEFTMCIVALNLQKRQKPELERFAEYEFSIKLFQVSVTNGSPKTAQLCDQPASQAAVHNPASWLPRIAGTGRAP